MLANIIGYNHVEDLAELAELCEDLIEELLEMKCGLDELFLWRLDPLGKRDGSLWVFVEVREKERLGQLWFVVLPCATVAVAACSYFVIEWTVNFIVLGPKFLCKPVSHSSSLDFWFFFINFRLQDLLFSNNN